ncbi:hypothetical protein [Nonomuraea sediminis]|uniref:hypothetical protein n=1 Tax=Nonomuraea sediminis TaxID=2835864 RepID=UPI001BDC653C|nr:hypothetical protein [Nonomuraea sediminis]
MTDLPAVRLPPDNAGQLHARRILPDGTRQVCVSWVETEKGWTGGLVERGPEWLAEDQVEYLPGQRYPAYEQFADGTADAGAQDAPLPPAWPPQVRPPGAPDWQASAVAWLLEALPPDFRAHPVLRDFPLALAWMATRHTEFATDAARAGYRSAAIDLKPHLSAEAIERVHDTYRAEGRRLVELARAIDAVTRELMRDPGAIPSHR